MSNSNVVTFQPTASAPPPYEDINLDACQKVVDTQPVNEDLDDMLKQAEEKGAERQRKKQDELCCTDCGCSSYENNDPFCWYFFCKLLCDCCNYICHGLAECPSDGCDCCMKVCCCCRDDGAAVDGGDCDGCGDCCSELCGACCSDGCGDCSF